MDDADKTKRATGNAKLNDHDINFSGHKESWLKTREHHPWTADFTAGGRLSHSRSVVWEETAFTIYLHISRADR
jgi:hypothetical protein